MNYKVEKRYGETATMKLEYPLSEGDTVQTYSEDPDKIDAAYIVLKARSIIRCSDCCLSIRNNAFYEAAGCILISMDGDCACPSGCAFHDIGTMMEEI